MSRDLMHEFLTRITWMQQEKNILPEQHRAWSEQARGFLEQIVAHPCPPLSLETEFDYREWHMAYELLESWDK